MAVHLRLRGSSFSRKGVGIKGDRSWQLRLIEINNVSELKNIRFKIKHWFSIVENASIPLPGHILGCGLTNTLYVLQYIKPHAQTLQGQMGQRNRPVCFATLVCFCSAFTVRLQLCRYRSGTVTQHISRSTGRDREKETQRKVCHQDYVFPVAQRKTQ